MLLGEDTMNAIQQWLCDQDPATIITLVVLVWVAFAVFVVRAFQVCEAQQRKITEERPVEQIDPLVTEIQANEAETRHSLGLDRGLEIENGATKPPQPLPPAGFRPASDATIPYDIRKLP
jgi:hypothetical protein